MKFSPGVVPQWPSRRGLTCSIASGCVQQRIVEQVDLSDRQIVGGAPVRVETRQVVGSERGVGVAIMHDYNAVGSAKFATASAR